MTGDRYLNESINGLRYRAPHLSAYWRLSGGQRRMLVTASGLVVLSLVILPVPTLIFANALLTALYLAAFLYSLCLFQGALRGPAVVAVSEQEARAIPDHELPIYCILLPAFREAPVIGRAIRALESLDYPRDRLEIMLLLEADDSATIAAALAASPGPAVRIVTVPHAWPRTKPKALNYGFEVCSGDLVTIFDAEDRPEPLQLRRAAAAFRRLDPTVACLQAKLRYHNVEQNLLTRWFSAEYLTWFSGTLPALVDLNAPIPLGGTSMHVRREALERVGGWDPFNVTEDADLGVRLHRLGFRTQVLDSVTFEEANSDFVNWVKQRSRWYKGYLQTWLVHMRNPGKLWAELGPAGFVGFNVLLGATPVLALLNPLVWLLPILWFFGRLDFIQTIFPAWLYYPAMISMLLGNFIALYRTVVSVRATGYPELLYAALLSPAYWVMMSMAALRAFLQLLVAASYWEKTVHGLDQSPAPQVQDARA